MTLTTPKKIIDFWLNEVGPAGGGMKQIKKFISKS